MESEHISHQALSSLTRWDRNYRVGDVDAIIASIVRFGFNATLRVWKDGRVMAGNHSLIALETMRANGAKPPRGVSIQDGDWMIPCVDVSHLSATEAAAFAIADNRIQELGKSDEQRLADLLQEISETDEGLDGTGFTEEDLQSLLASLKEPEFEPATEEEQGKLDQKNPVKCPSCGHEFVPTKASLV